MITRKLTAAKYERLHHSLAAKARAAPLSAAYEVDMTVNGVEYTLKVQPEKSRIVALQALRVDRDENGHDFQLITRGAVLSALLELLIHQWVA